jgi:alpha-galactosidase
MAIEQCNAVLSDNVLVLQNSCIRREFLWNHGHLISQRIEDLRSGQAWTLAGLKPDCEFPNQPCEPADGTLETVPCAATAILPEHLRIDCTYRLGDLWIRRCFRLFRDCPAIGCDFCLKGKPSSTWRAGDAPPSGRPDFETEWAARQGRVRPTVMERIGAPGRHLKMTCVQFFDVTDRRNNLLATRTVLSYRQETRLAGNLLFIRDILAPRGLFVLKEAPCSDMQLAWPGCDFVIARDETQVVGLGVMPEDLRPGEWTRCYGVVVGVAGSDEYSLLSALRTYQSNLRVHKGGRDSSIMLNTWGDRSATARICERFCIEELDAGSRLGVSHFQVDDGWQTGEFTNRPAGTSRPEVPGRLDPRYDSRRFWAIDPARFPKGFGPVAEHARKVGIELCLWFCPSPLDSYAHWEADADVLIDLHERYGIRTFKIDGVDIPDKLADIRFRAILDKVMDATDGQAVFNLDATAGRRFGYHYLTQYGNVFLENRYTDWSNYYPHWTLRNLWTLSRYVPPQNLQIEFLNRWRNPDKYPADDPLAPCRVPFDYCFAIAMMAQPLAWFEASNLPQEAFQIAPLIGTYRKHQERIHAGQIFPIGDEPDGTTWTGFQSVRPDGGYLLVFREYNQAESAPLALWGLAGRRIRCTAVLGHGADFESDVNGAGRVIFHLPGPHTFALYEYTVRNGGG